MTFPWRMLTDFPILAELCSKLEKASTTLGWLTKRVPRNWCLSVCTRVGVYEAGVLSLLLYRAECWPTYHTQVSSEFLTYEITSYRIIGKTWEDRMTYAKLFIITKSEPLSSHLKFMRLRWSGHVNRMSFHRISHMLLHSILINGNTA